MSETIRPVGIMQGRLSPRPPGRLQAFPSASWQQEFAEAKALGLAGIEWIFEAERAEANPLVTTQGRAAIRDIIQSSGVPVLSICGDYFMRHRLSEEGPAGQEASGRLSRLASEAAEIGAKRILLPWLEEAALTTPVRRATAIANLKKALPSAEKHQLQFGLEMEIPGSEYAALLEEINHSLVVAYYDTGNSTAAGANVAEDIVPLLGRLAAVHIKDRVRGGTTRPLGQGDTNFAGLFRVLGGSGFRGPVVLQHYFEDPVADARSALALVRSFWTAAQSGGG